MMDMAVESTQTLVYPKATNDEIRKLLLQYNNIIHKLRQYGIIKTSSVVAGYGEYIAAKRLNLTLNKNPSQKGYDAVDKNNIKYQIKTRKATSWNKPTIFPFDKTKIGYIDFLVYVGFNDDWSVRDFLKIPKKYITPNKANRIVLTKQLKKRFRVVSKNQQRLV